jgi:hypothetical protein
MVKGVKNKKKRHPFVCRILVQFYGCMKFVLCLTLSACVPVDRQTSGWISIGPVILLSCDSILVVIKYDNRISTGFYWLVEIEVMKIKTCCCHHNRVRFVLSSADADADADALCSK